MKSQARFAIVMTLAVAVLAMAGSAFLWMPSAIAGEDAVAAIVMEADVWKWGLIAAALATGLSSLAAAYAVGQIGTAAMGTLAEKPELFGRLIIFLGLAEGIAIYGLIISVLILNRLV